MPLVNEVYASKYLNATDLPEGRRVTAIVVTAVQELVGQGEQAKLLIVLGLRAVDGRPWPKLVPMNKTNATMVGSVYGNNSDGWIGRPIEVWREMTMFQGRVVPGVRTAAAMPPPPQSAPAAAPHPIPTGNSSAIPLPPPAPVPAADMTTAYAPIPGAPPAPAQPRTVDEALAAQRPPLAQPRTVVFPDGQTPSYADIPGGPDADTLDDAIPF